MKKVLTLLLLVIGLGLNAQTFNFSCTDVDTSRFYFTTNKRTFTAHFNGYTASRVQWRMNTVSTGTNPFEGDNEGSWENSFSAQNPSANFILDNDSTHGPDNYVIVTINGQDFRITARSECEALEQAGAEVCDAKTLGSLVPGDRFEFSIGDFTHTVTVPEGSGGNRYGGDFTYEGTSYFFSFPIGARSGVRLAIFSANAFTEVFHLGNDKTVGDLKDAIPRYILYNGLTDAELVRQLIVYSSLQFSNGLPFIQINDDYPHESLPEGLEWTWNTLEPTQFYTGGVNADGTYCWGASCGGRNLYASFENPAPGYRQGGLVNSLDAMMNIFYPGIGVEFKFRLNGTESQWSHAIQGDYGYNHRNHNPFDFTINQAYIDAPVHSESYFRLHPTLPWTNTKNNHGGIDLRTAQILVTINDGNQRVIGAAYRQGPNYDACAAVYTNNCELRHIPGDHVIDFPDLGFSLIVGNPNRRVTNFNGGQLAFNKVGDEYVFQAKKQGLLTSVNDNVIARFNQSYNLNEVRQRIIDHMLGGGIQWRNGLPYVVPSFSFPNLKWQWDSYEPGQDTSQYATNNTDGTYCWGCPAQGFADFDNPASGYEVGQIHPNIATVMENIAPPGVRIAFRFQVGNTTSNWNDNYFNHRDDAPIDFRFHDTEGRVILLNNRLGSGEVPVLYIREHSNDSWERIGIWTNSEQPQSVINRDLRRHQVRMDVERGGAVVGMSYKVGPNWSAPSQFELDGGTIEQINANGSSIVDIRNNTNYIIHVYYDFNEPGDVGKTIVAGRRLGQVLPDGFSVTVTIRRNNNNGEILHQETFTN